MAKSTKTVVLQLQQVVKVIWQQTALPPHMDGSVVFARLRPYLIHAFLGRRQVHIPNGISIGSAVFAHLTAESHYTLQWAAAFPVQNCPFP